MNPSHACICTFQAALRLLTVLPSQDFEAVTFHALLGAPRDGMQSPLRTCHWINWSVAIFVLAPFTLFAAATQS